MYSLMNISGKPAVIFLSICKERLRLVIVPKASIDSCTKSFRCFSESIAMPKSSMDRNGCSIIQK